MKRPTNAGMMFWKATSAEMGERYSRMNPSSPERMKVTIPMPVVLQPSRNFRRPAWPRLPPFGHSDMSMNVMMVHRIQ